MRKTFAGRWLAALLTLALICSLAPASFADDPTPTVSLDHTSLTIAAGGTAELTATINNATDAVITKWESGNASVTVVKNSDNGNKARVTVSADAVAGSKATITATYTVTDTDGSEKEYFDTCEITVENSSGGGGTSGSTELTKIEVEITIDGITNNTLSMLYGDRAGLTAKVKAFYGDDDTVGRVINSGAFFKWDSSKEEVATTDNNTRNLQAVGEGESTITCTATFGGKDAKATCTVKVGPRIGVIITQYDFSTTKIEGQAGTSIPLKALVVVNDKTFNDKKFTWKSDNDKVATVNENGVVQTVAPGTADITATYEQDNKEYSCTVTCTVRSGSSGGSDPGTTTPSGELPEGITVDRVVITAPEQGAVMEQGTQNITAVVYFSDQKSAPVEWSRDGRTATAVYVSGTGSKHTIGVKWDSSDKNVAGVASGMITAQKPGKATITAETIGGKKAELEVTVKGFILGKSELVLEENKSVELLSSGVLETYGDPDFSGLTCWSDNSTVAAYVGGKIEAYKPGTTRFTVSDPKRGFQASFDVTVIADPNATIPRTGTITIKGTETLEFSDWLSSFRRQAGGSLSHITGVNMASSGGDLYYKYNATTGAGTGVGAENYYHPYRAGGIPYGQRSLEDLTFVPKKGYAGQVTIHYTGVSEEGKNYVCQLLVTVDPESGSDAGISLTTPYNTALRLNGDDFNRVCRERLGVKLDHVVFSQPPERQGTLYTDYVGPGNYGKVVSPSTRYSLKQLDDIWFVPAPGFSGTVTLYYTAYGTGTNAGSFAGQATITVGREDGVAIGGLTFDTVRGSAVRFDDERFNSYCRQVLQEENWYDRQTLSRVRFDALPSASEGVLYYDYRSSSNTGTRAEAGTSYYYGTRNPRLDRLTFVPAADFIGTVKIPFTGWTSDGTSFTGNVEVNVRGGSGHGDILYVCQPGKTVSFRSSDFANLSRDLTGRTISYIVFRDLPGSSDGSLYYNNSRITTTGARYQNSSIGRLSFRASNSFSGAVDIPFEGQSTSGETFSGVVTISTSSSGGSGSSTSWGNIRYTSRDGAAAVFDRYDFDSMSQWYNREDVSSVRFQAPASTWGDLYRNYRSSSNPGTRIASSANIAQGGLDQVAFVPAGSYTGTVYVDFTAVSDDGSTFSGTVEIAVERSTWNIPTTVPTRFSDVASNAYYADAVKWAVSNGITSGTSSTTFSPQQTCTVAQILSFLYRANGSPRVTGSNPFTDVRTSDYYYEAALWAHQKGLVSGSAFHPFSPCTRSMVVTYLWKLAGQPAAARPISYSPYTLTGSREYQIYDEQIGTNISRRSSFTLRFDAAATAKTRITLHHDNDELGYISHDFEPPETYDVTVIAVRPGSSYTIDGGFYGFSYMSEGSTYFNGVPGTPFFRASDGSFRRALTQMGHDDSEFALYENSLSWFRENGAQSSIWGNNGSTDCGVLIQLNGAYYFVTYADSATAGGLMSGTTGFSDVPASASYAQAVAWATEQKITSGTSKTTFSPNNTCTRGQIVTFLYRAMGW